MTRRSRNSKAVAQTGSALASYLAVAALAACDAAPPHAIGEESVQESEAQVAAQMVALMQEVSLERAKSDGLVRRFNQVKTIGCVDATFSVPELPAQRSHGLFRTPGVYRAYVRFANATQDDDRKSDFRGMSIRIDGVAGASTAMGGHGSRQDFLLNSYPALFAANPDDFLAFIRAGAKGRTLAYFVNPLDSHLYSLRVVLSGRDVATSPLALRYWSTTPFRYGESSDSAVKFSAAPCGGQQSAVDAGDHPDRLREAMAAQLEHVGACFDFLVQFQTDPLRMPIEDASVTWPEELSPFQPIAKLTIEAQSFSEEAAMATCERATFNPWNALPAHRPLGGINRVRREIYDQMGEFRNAANNR